MSNESDTNSDKNTGAVRRVLDKLKVVYVARPRQPDVDGLTTIYYESSKSETGWQTNLFSSEDSLTIRMFSWLDADWSGSDQHRLLEAVNLANYDFLLDTVVDYSYESKRIRIRDVVHGCGAEFEDNEIAKALASHLARVVVWNSVFASVIPGNVQIQEAMPFILEETQARLRAMAESDAAPPEVGTNTR